MSVSHCTLALVQRGIITLTSMILLDHFNSTINDGVFFLDEQLLKKKGVHLNFEESALSFFKKKQKKHQLSLLLQGKYGEGTITTTFYRWLYKNKVSESFFFFFFFFSTQQCRLSHVYEHKCPVALSAEHSYRRRPKHTRNKC